MATIIRGSGGSGGRAASNALIANTDASKVLSDENFVNADGDLAEGTMPINEATAINLGLGGSYTIPIGYHTGEGVITVGPNTVVEVRTVTIDNSSPLVNSMDLYNNRTSSAIVCNEGDIVIATLYIKHRFDGTTDATFARIDANTNPNASTTSSLMNTWQNLATSEGWCGLSTYFISKNTSETSFQNNAYRAVRFVAQIPSSSSSQLVGTVYIIHTQ